MIYLDASAFVKLYVDEPDSARCETIVSADPDWMSARHTVVEVRRNLSRLLQGRALANARRGFDADWARTNIIELDEHTCRLAAGIAEATSARSLDALHLGAAQRALGGLAFLTFDVRQAQIARTLGMNVIGT